MNYLVKFGTELWTIFLEMSPYLLLGFFFAGLMHLLFPGKKVSKYLGGNNFKSVLNASLIGVPLPLCSCGVIPIGLAFYRHGASRPSTVSFLISTPQTGADSIMVTWSLLGLPFAIIRPVVAFLTGLFGGLLTKRLYKGDKNISKNGPDNSREIPSGFIPKLKELFRYPFVEFMQDIAKWLVIGLLIAALISVIVPDNYFADKLPGNFAGMILILVAAIPVYICATASVPIAAVLMLKGLSPGAALVLLMAGPATNAATITMIGKEMGKKTLIGYLSAIIVGALIAGSIIDYLLPAQWFVPSIHAAHAGHNHEILPAWLSTSSAVVLVLLILNALRKIYLPKIFAGINRKGDSEPGTINITTLTVEGMSCNNCRRNVENSAISKAGVSSARVDLETGMVEIKGSGYNVDEIIKSIESMGYRVVKKD